MVKNMLPPRQILLVAGLLLLSVASSISAEPGTTDASASPALAVSEDWRTGLAIHGVDPVGYFLQNEVVEGQGAFELRHAGAVWRFANEGNRAAFAANPDVYMPAFGGHDPVALARGVRLGGNPHIFVLYGERVFLFRTPEARAAFLADARETIAQARARAADLAESSGEAQFTESDRAAPDHHTR